jgi:hypothetical protein
MHSGAIAGDAGWPRRRDTPTQPIILASQAIAQGFLIRATKCSLAIIFSCSTGSAMLVVFAFVFWNAAGVATISNGKVAALLKYWACGAAA